MKLTDEQLVLAYKQGQKDAFDEIYLRYKNAVLCYAHSVYCIGADIEDVVQEGTLGLVKAVEYYNGKSSFKNFAFTCIKTNIIKAVKKMLSIKNLPLNNSLDINECEKELKKVGDNLEDKIIFKEKFDALLEKAKEDLSPFELKVLNLFTEGYSYVEIAQKLGRNPKTCDNALQRIKRKLSGDNN